MMKFYNILLGIGFLAGAAVFAVKMADRFLNTADEDWVVSPEMDEDEAGAFGAENTGSAENTADATAHAHASPEAAVPAEHAFMPRTQPVGAAPQEAEGEKRVIDFTTIARAEDFQDWDQFGCKS